MLPLSPFVDPPIPAIYKVIIVQGDIMGSTFYRVTFLSMHPIIPEIRLYFKIWTWKFMVKVMSGQKSKPDNGSTILSTHIPFVPFPSDFPFLRYDYFNSWPWNRVQGQGSRLLCGFDILSRHIYFVLCQYSPHVAVIYMYMAPWSRYFTCILWEMFEMDIQIFVRSNS